MLKALGGAALAIAVASTTQAEVTFVKELPWSEQTVTASAGGSGGGGGSGPEPAPPGQWSIHDIAAGFFFDDYTVSETSIIVASDASVPGVNPGTRCNALTSYIPGTFTVDGSGGTCEFTAMDPAAPFVDESDIQNACGWYEGNFDATAKTCEGLDQ